MYGEQMFGFIKFNNMVSITFSVGLKKCILCIRVVDRRSALSGGASGDFPWMDDGITQTCIKQINKYSNK